MILASYPFPLTNVKVFGLLGRERHQVAQINPVNPIDGLVIRVLKLGQAIIGKALYRVRLLGQPARREMEETSDPTVSRRKGEKSWHSYKFKVLACAGYVPQDSVGPGRHTLLL